MLLTVTALSQVGGKLHVVVWVTQEPSDTGLLAYRSRQLFTGYVDGELTDDKLISDAAVTLAELLVSQVASGL